MGKSTWSLERSAASSQLKRFIAEKCAQVRAEPRAPEHPQSPVSSSFFAAAERADWPGVFDAIVEMHRAMRERRSRNAPWAVYPVEWAVINEIGATLEEFAAGEEKYAIAFARDIINSIPHGSIYFGGTDPGRFWSRHCPVAHKRRAVLHHYSKCFGRPQELPSVSARHVWKPDLRSDGGGRNPGVDEYEQDARRRQARASCCRANAWKKSAANSRNPRTD